MHLYVVILAVISASLLGLVSCREDIAQAIHTKCKHGDILKDGCNTCRCGNGQWMLCTLALCDPLSPQEIQEIQALQIAGTTCRDGDRKVITTVKGWNTTCRCKNGYWLCADPVRSSLSRKTIGGDAFTCTPGKSFKKDCNTCFCTDGYKEHSYCTLMGCLGWKGA